MLHRELAKKGKYISEHQIRKIMRKHDLVARYGRPKAKNINTHKELAEKYISDNVYWNTKEPERPKKVWSTDFTEEKIEGKTVYTCGIISVNDKRLIARITGEKNNSATACATLQLGISRYGAPDMIMTDRGSPFVSKSFHELLESNQIIHSMSRPHTPRDNRYIETFWRMMKTEIGSVKKMDLNEYMMVMGYYEFYYNHCRPHSALGYMTPAEADEHTNSLLASSPSAPSLSNCSYA